MADAQLGEGRQFNLHSAGTDLVEGSALAVKGGSGAITVDGFTETTINVLGVGGGSAHDAVDAGYPVKVGGHAYSGVPAAVSATNDRVDAAFTLRGGLHVNLRDSSGAEILTGVQYVEDAPLGAVGTAQGSLVLGRSSAAAPTAVSADADAVAAWYLRSGQQVVAIASGTALIGGDATGGLHAQGAIAHDAVDSGNPLKIGGYASTTRPSTVATADRVNGWFGTGGELVVATVSGISSGADAQSANQVVTPSGLATTPSPTAGYAYNGATWDRVRTANGVTGFLGVGGPTAGDAVLAVAPVTVGGRASNAAPTAVSADGDVVNARFTQTGALNVYMVDQAGAAASLGGGTQYVGDAAATATPTGTISMGLANAAAPSDVSANNDAVAAWMLRNGSQVVNLASGGTLVTLGSKVSASSLPVVIASDQGAVAVSGTFWQATQPVSGTVTANAGTGNFLVAGPTASDAALTVSPQTIGGRASTATPTAMSADGDVVDLWMTRRGSATVELRDDSGATPTFLTWGNADAVTVANVTALSGNVLGWLYNGTTADRMRSALGVTGSVSVGGPTASDAALAAAPITIGGRASNAAPTAMSADGDVVDARFTRTGALNVYMVDQAGAAASLGGGTQYVGDAAATATPTGTISMGLANAAAPSDVSANNDAVAAWYLRNGAAVVNVAAGGTLWTNMGQTAATGQFARLTDGTLTVGAVDETGASAVDALAVGGGTPHDSVDSGNPVKMGGFASSTPPTSVAASDRVNAWLGLQGAQVIAFQNRVGGADAVTGNVIYPIGADGNNAPFGVVSLLYNGSTWDRTRSEGTTGFLGVGGSVVHDAVDAGNPVKVGGYTSLAPPTNASADGDRVNAWFGRSGAFMSAIGYNVGAGGDGQSQFYLNSSSATSSSAPTPLGAAAYIYNGASWDRVRSAPGGTGVLGVGGPTASDAVLSYAPLTIGGRASNAAPTAMSNDGDVVDARFTRTGALNVYLVDQAGAAVMTAITALDAAPNVDTGIAAVGVGPGWDRKRDPAGVAATSTANAVTVVVDGADVVQFHVTTIGTTPGSMIIETTGDDANWATGGAVIKLGSTEQWIEGSFVPAVNDVYIVRTTGQRQVRYRVNAVYASGTATVKVTSSVGSAIVKAVEMAPAPHKTGYTAVNLSETYTSAQTSTAIKTAPGNAANVVSSTQKFVVTSVQIQAYATTAFTCIVYFGTGAFTRSTSRVVFDGEFVPSATSKPGVVQNFPINPPIGAADEELRITTVGVGSVTVNVWGYLIVA